MHMQYACVSNRSLTSTHLSRVACRRALRQGCRSSSGSGKLPVAPEYTIFHQVTASPPPLLYHSIKMIILPRQARDMRTLGKRSKKAFFLQAPPCDDTRGWIEYEDVPVGAAYTLDHTVLMASDYFFSRPLIGRLRALQPVRRNTTATCFAPFSHC
jgi:hypothetical protein